jgi:hypothetical protein
MQVIGKASICRRFLTVHLWPGKCSLRLVPMLSKSVDRLPAYLNTHQIDEPQSAVRERRRRARVQVHWPIRFVRPGTVEIVETVTHDLSSDGFYCMANTAFVPGEIRECTLGVPMHNPDKDRVRPVLCRVRVIRVEALAEGGFYGLGCRIEDYRFLPPTE